MSASPETKSKPYFKFGGSGTPRKRLSEKIGDSSSPSTPRKDSESPRRSDAIIKISKQSSESGPGRNIKLAKRKSYFSKTRKKEDDIDDDDELAISDEDSHHE